MKTFKNILSQLSLSLQDDNKGFRNKDLFLTYLGIALVLLGIVLLPNTNESIFSFFHSLALKNTILSSLFIFAAQYLYLAIACIFFLSLLFWIRERKMQMFLLFIFTIVLAYILSRISGPLIPDTRPYIIHNFTPLIHVAHDNGFPSDHALLSFAVVIPLLWSSKQFSFYLFILALFVGIARIGVGAHHPLDIVGSLILVEISFAVGYFLLRAISYYLTHYEKEI